MATETIQYDNKIVRNFAVAVLVWGVVGMLVGLIIAIQMFVPALNLGLSYTTFSHLRPLHTNAVIFAFVGNGIFSSGLYYSLPRLCKAPMWSTLLSNINFWGWQLIVLAALTLPAGIT